MGIHLDWELESDDGQQMVEEDSAVVAARRRRFRRLRTLAVTALALFVVMSGAGWWRLRQVEKGLRHELENTVAAETLALRLGDKHAFMKAQSSDEIWRSAQRRTFDDIRRYGQRMYFGGEIKSIKLSGNDAQVVIGLTVDGEPAEVTWLYRHTEEGWKHVLSEAWLQRTWKTSDTDYVYYLPDQRLAESAQESLGVWWPQMVEKLGYSEPPFHLTIRIVPDASALIGWTDSDQRVLQIPSVSLSGTPIREMNESMKQALAQALAKRMARAALGRDVPQYQTWVEDELEVLLLHEIDPSTPAPAILGPLEEVFGEELIHDFIRQNRDGSLGAIALRQAMIQQAPDLSNPEDRTHYITQFLKAEAALSQWEMKDGCDGGDCWHTTTAFRDQTLDNDRNSVYTGAVGIEGLDPSVLSIIRTYEFGGIIWAEVKFPLPMDDIEAMTGTALPIEISILIPFRQVDGLWVHARQVPLDAWGGPHEITTDNVALVYHDLDEPYIEGLVPYIDRVYQQVSADFGVDSALPIRIIIEANPGTYSYGPPSEAAQITLTISSPHIQCCDPNLTPADSLRRYVTDAMIRQIFNVKVGSQDVYSPFNEAFLYWETSRFDAGYWWMELPIAMPEAAPQSLQALWEGPGATDDFRVQVTYLVGTRVLLDLLVEKYGEDAIPVLVDNLSTSFSMEEWLQNSLDITTQDIEAEWQVRFARAIADQE